MERAGLEEYPSRQAETESKDQTGPAGTAFWALQRAIFLMRSVDFLPNMCG